MNFIPEESKREAELRKKVEAAFGSDPEAPASLKSREDRKSISAKEKAERARKDYEQKQKTLEYKRDRLEWQKERSKLKDKQRREAEERRKKRQENGGTSPNIKIEPITDKDRDPTAYKKAIGGVASYAKAAVGVGARAVMNAAKKRKEQKEKERQEAAQKQSQRQRERTQSAMSQSSRLLPGNVQGETQGQRARRDPSFKKREIQRRGGTTTEEFSCWREEFLYELGDLRKSKKTKDEKEKIIDVMKGKNSIKISPDIKEEFFSERKRDSLANAVLGLAFASNAAQSPEALLRSGHIEAPGIQLMSRMMRNRKEADRNLDSGRVSHPSRNRKNKEKVTEALDKTQLLKAIVKKLVDEKKRKNSLLTKGYIGEDKENMKCNKPQRAPKGAKQKYIVKACDSGKEKVLRFGYRGMQDFLQHKDEKRRAKFKARHRCSEKSDKLTPGWWACNYNW